MDILKVGGKSGLSDNAANARPFRILSLDGGGVLGLATASFLAEMERHFKTRCADQFDMFCGTSTGSIIALGLASGMDAAHVVEVYRDMAPRIFGSPFPGSRWLRTFSSLLVPKFGNRNLILALDEQFGETTLGEVLVRGKYVAIPAFSLTTGRPRVFKTDHAAGLSRDNSLRLSQVALASAAAPIYLPPVALPARSGNGDEWYIDGGVFANDPALVAYTEAVCDLKIAAPSVQILSVSTPRISLAETRGPSSSLRERLRMLRGVVRWGSGLATILIDSSSTIQSSVLNRLHISGNGPGVYERFLLQSRTGLEMDRPTPEALNTLTTLGENEAANGDARRRVAALFAPLEIAHGRPSDTV